MALDTVSETMTPMHYHLREIIICTYRQVSPLFPSAPSNPEAAAGLWDQPCPSWILSQAEALWCVTREVPGLSWSRSLPLILCCPASHPQSCPCGSSLHPTSHPAFLSSGIPSVPRGAAGRGQGWSVPLRFQHRRILRVWEGDSALGSGAAPGNSLVHCRLSLRPTALFHLGASVELMKKQKGLFSSDLRYFKPVELYHRALEGQSPGFGVVPGMVCATSHQCLTSAPAPAALDLCFQLMAAND